MPGLVLNSSRSFRPVMLVVVVALVVGVATCSAMGVHASPVPSVSFQDDTLLGLLLRLADAVGDLVMRIQDEVEGWTIA